MATRSSRRNDQRRLPPTDSLSRRLGIDVGGARNDAIILNRASRLMARFKWPTYADATSGIRHALDGRVRSADSLDHYAIRHARLGRTHRVTVNAEVIATGGMAGPTQHMRWLAIYSTSHTRSALTRRTVQATQAAA